MHDPARPRVYGKTTTRSFRLGIIGCGPRGLAAAEFALARLPSCRIEIFDPSDWPAAGPNFALDEVSCCLLNLRAGDVDLPTPPMREHLSFRDWLQSKHGKGADHYPPRHLLGHYLHERFVALAQTFPKALIHRQQTAVDAWQDATGWWVATHSGSYGPYDELVLTMGQPVTQADLTWQNWRARAVECGVVVAPAYPGHVLQRKAAAWAGKTVAIRGLGLAALDVLSLLTLGQGGRLAEGRYFRSGQEPGVILPFSLDGMPPMPKPCLEVEGRLTVTQSEHARLCAAVSHALQLQPQSALGTISAALAAPAERLSGGDPAAWLRVECDADRKHDRKAVPIEVLRDGIEMAAGRKPASVGYCIGQIWRQFQSDLRRIFLASDGPPETRAAILGFDRGLKRMTYGPPLSSAELMLALVEDGLLRLTVAEDPAIRLTAQGWVFDNRTHAQVMIDAVLPAPRLDGLDDSLIRALQHQGALREDKRTGGIAVDKAGRASAGLSVLGRLTEGRCIATDSIHDCFGELTCSWANKLGGDADAPEAAQGAGA